MGSVARSRIPAGYREPLLVASTDGVGTKTAIAAALGRFDTIGIDLVAMCADDVVCSGAEPLAFLDYVAVGHVVPEGVAELVGSVAAGCREAGCALVGGETAEHPGLDDRRRVRPVGMLHRRRRAGRTSSTGPRSGPATSSSACRRPGCTPTATRSSGRSSPSGSSTWPSPTRLRLRRTLGDAEADAVIAAAPNEAMATLGEVLLTPTRIYARAVLAARAAVRAAGTTSTASPTSPAAACPGNVPRALPDGLAARLDPSRWTMPSVMRLFGALGGLDDEELRATFNGGLGMVVVLPRRRVEAAIAALEAHGIAADGRRRGRRGGERRRGALRRGAARGLPPGAGA